MSRKKKTEENFEPKIQQLKKQLDDFKISLRFAEMNTMIDQFSTFLKQKNVMLLRMKKLLTFI